MSKTFRKFNKKPSRNYYDDSEDDSYQTRTNYTKKRIERNIDNIIRSKNINKLMELDDNEYGDDDELNIHR